MLTFNEWIATKDVNKLASPDSGSVYDDDWSNDDHDLGDLGGRNRRDIAKLPKDMKVDRRSLKQLVQTGELSYLADLAKRGHEDAKRKLRTLIDEYPNKDKLAKAFAMAGEYGLANAISGKMKGGLGHLF